MDVQSRCTEYVAAVGHRRRSGATVPTHLVASAGKSGGWAKCGEPLDRLRHVGIGSVPWVEATCRACREKHIREKQALKPGWWARKLEARP